MSRPSPGARILLAHVKSGGDAGRAPIRLGTCVHGLARPRVRAPAEWGLTHGGAVAERPLLARTLGRRDSEGGSSVGRRTR